MTCNFCGGSEIVVNQDRGERICCSCGSVLEGNIMVNDLQFSETRGVIGQFISFATGTTSNKRSGETRAETIQRGRDRIQRIGEALKISYSSIEAAHRIYTIALQRNFTIGRPSIYISAACLYIICRREKTPYMLIDFSDVIKVRVRVLAQVYMKLVRNLHISVPNIEPSIYIDRFLNQLNIKDKTAEISSTAMRLIQCMSRDWIVTGRRPSGLCGAALVLSARYHNEVVSIADMVEIVRISQHTIAKRLYEFGRTKLASLTKKEFEETNIETLPILTLPPCIKEGKRKTERKELRRKEITSYEATKEEDISRVEIESIMSDMVSTIQNKNRNNIELEDLNEMIFNIDIPEVNDDEHDEGENFSDVSDEEINKYILNINERSMKQQIWNDIAKDFPIKVKRKIISNLGSTRKKQKSILEFTAADSVVTATKAALFEKSCRAGNYFDEDILSDLFNSVKL